MPLTNDTNQITIKDLEELDKHISAVVRKTHEEILNEVEKLRREINELREQAPPKLKKL